ncbi:MAG: DUF3422 domain-containing protein [Aquificae bacterium]|nr:DUF3422 domain-containing protein [Aquificota bacterium]
MKKKLLAFLLLLNVGFSLSPQEERQLLRDIAEIKATLKTFMEQTDKRFETVDKRLEELRQDINKRFEAVDRRFEDINRRIEELRQDMNARFEAVDRRFEQLYTFLWIITGIFTTLTVSVIAFAWWDRRTIIRKAKEETFEEMEKEIRPEKLKKLLNALREKAKTDKELEAILKKYGLL